MARSAICVICILAAQTAGASIIDQSYTPLGGSGPLVASGTLYAQTITAGISGDLSQLDLWVSESNSPADPLVLQIRTTSAGLPSGTVLFEQAIAAATTTGVPPAPTQVDLSPHNLGFAAGDVFSVVLKTESSGPDVGYKWWGQLGNDYAGGIGSRSFDNGSFMGSGCAEQS